MILIGFPISNGMHEILFSLSLTQFHSAKYPDTFRGKFSPFAHQLKDSSLEDDRRDCRLNFWMLWSRHYTQTRVDFQLMYQGHKWESLNASK